MDWLVFTAVAAFFFIGGYYLGRCDGIKMSFFIWGLGVFFLTFFGGKSLPDVLQNYTYPQMFLIGSGLWVISVGLHWFDRVKRPHSALPHLHGQKTSALQQNS